MNPDMVSKIQKIYKESKVLAEQYKCTDVLFNDGRAQKEIMDEYAKQINIANMYRQKEKDLNFLYAILTDAKNSAKSSPGKQESAKLEKQLATWVDNIYLLLKVYYTINQMQTSILKYYERGGATF